ncbi:MAG TPA: hypothetical protein VJN94_03740 [Candidatus Binataceae bacterium]|nr:hypothetical protein [Candidatus Binataceae bacterium]
MKSKTNPEFDEFTRTVDKLLSVPREELQRREKEYREQVARNPRKRGPKKKLKSSASRDLGDGA